MIVFTPTEDVKVDVVLKDEIIWARLDSSATVSKMEAVVQRGFRGKVSDERTLYSLDMIIAFA